MLKRKSNRNGERCAVHVAQHEYGTFDANSLLGVRFPDNSSGEDESVLDSKLEKAIDVNQLELSAEVLEDYLSDEIHLARASVLQESMVHSACRRCTAT